VPLHVGTSLERSSPEQLADRLSECGLVGGAERAELTYDERLFDGGGYRLHRRGFKQAGSSPLVDQDLARVGILAKLGGDRHDYDLAAL
jgi:hypothetical protein